MTNKDCLYEWVFHYNIYTGFWNAFKREDYSFYFNDSENPDLCVYKSTKIETLIEILVKMNCDPNGIAEL